MITLATFTCALTTLVTQTPASAPQGVPSSFFWGDFNGDGLDDAFVVSPGAARLLQNLGDGAFEDVSELLGVPAVPDVRAAAWADWNSDGSLDLFLCSGSGESRLLDLGPAGLFVDVTVRAGLSAIPASDARWLDFDADGRPDLRLATAAGEILYHNIGGAFVEVDLGAPAVAFGSAGSDRAPAGADPVAGGGPAPRPEGPSGRGSGGGNEASAGPGGGVVTGGSALGGGAVSASASTACVTGLEDQAGGNCIRASRTATIGMLYPLGADFFVDATTGRVGIGTTTPASPLDVAGSVRSSGGSFRSYNTNNENASVSLGWLDDVARIRYGGSGAGASGGFEIQRVGDQTIFRLADNGNLGLGTTAPAEKLEVVGDLRLRSSSDVNTAITSGILQLRNTAGSQAVLIDSNEIASFGGPLNLNTSDIGEQVRMDGDTLVVDPVGRVGVGTDTPDALLDVAGNAVLDNQLAAGHAVFSGQVFGGSAVGTVINITQPGTGSQGNGINVTNSTAGGNGVRVVMDGSTNGSAAGFSALVNTGTGRAVEAFTATGVTGYFQAQDSTVVDVNRIVNTGTLLQARNGSDVEFRVDSDGNVYCDDSFINTGADYAEWLERAEYDEEIGPADVVGVRGGKISRDLEGAEQILVVSTAPALIGNALGAESSERDGHEVVAFIGQAPVKVRGPVRSGDFILPSGQSDGTAVARAPRELTADELPLVLGRAWEASDAEGLHLVNVAIGVDQAAAAAIVIESLHAELTRLAPLAGRVDALESAVASLLSRRTE